MSSNGSGGWNETVLYHFTNPSKLGSFPNSNVLIDAAGNLYGTTEAGGSFTNGVAYKLSLVGSTWTETVLHVFGSGVDGQNPVGDLIMDPSGNIYGTTIYGGTNRGGTVFELSFSNGAWRERVIYNSSTGMTPGLAMGSNGTIYGVGNSTIAGATPIFALAKNSSGSWNATIIYKFPSVPKPAGSLALDAAGNLYGTTDADANGCGKVYKLTHGTSGAWTLKNLYNFVKGGTDACIPYSGIVFDTAGHIYGTSFRGGTSGHGAVYELTPPSGTGAYTERVLWSFNGTDGASPTSTPTLTSAGNLYGTTYAGGSKGDGVVFELTP